MARSSTQPLVSFVVAGTQKAGTSALDQMLRHHGELCLPRMKEAHFFDSEDPAFGPAQYATYEALFPPAARGKVCGEITPIYMYWRDSFDRMAQYNPAMRIVMILRDPVERAHSQWAMEVDRGKENLNFGDALREEEIRLEMAKGHQHRIYAYADRGRYAKQIKRAWSFFGRDSVHLIRYEDYINNPSKALAEILSFVGVSDRVRLPIIRRFETGRPPVPSKDAAFLLGCVRDDIDELEALTGWNLESWRAWS